MQSGPLRQKGSCSRGHLPKPHMVDPATPCVSKYPDGNRIHKGITLGRAHRTGRRLSAILAADVYGYSRLMGADEVATHALTARREILDGLIAAHGGRIVKTAGDRVLAEFPSAVEAVRGAMEVQEPGSKPISGPREPHIKFRVGVHVGDVMVRRMTSLVTASTSRRGFRAREGRGALHLGLTYDQVRKRLPLRSPTWARRPSRTSNGRSAPTWSAAKQRTLIWVEARYRSVFPSLCCRSPISAAIPSKTISSMA